VASLPLCVFDLDHTLVRSSLDLLAVRAEVRALAARHGVPLPDARTGPTIAQLIGVMAEVDPALADSAWELVQEHETRALDSVESEPGAGTAATALLAAGFVLAVWTNNARQVAEVALARSGLAGFFPWLVTRDEAALKPDPAGLGVLRRAHPDARVWVVGDSWIDGAAALAGGATFIAYRADPGELARRRVTPALLVDDLRALPGWLSAQRGAWS
jgi:phosphoglycolate phosphatase-like HAD superfamily hydrolase